MAVKSLCQYSCLFIRVLASTHVYPLDSLTVLIFIHQTLCQYSYLSIRLFASTHIYPLESLPVLIAIHQSSCQYSCLSIRVLASTHIYPLDSLPVLIAIHQGPCQYSQLSIRVLASTHSYPLDCLPLIIFIYQSPCQYSYLSILSIMIYNVAAKSPCQYSYLYPLESLPLLMLIYQSPCQYTCLYIYQSPFQYSYLSIRVLSSTHFYPSGTYGVAVTALAIRVFILSILSNIIHCGIQRHCQYSYLCILWKETVRHLEPLLLLFLQNTQCDNTKKECLAVTDVSPHSVTIKKKSAWLPLMLLHTVWKHLVPLRRRTRILIFSVLRSEVLGSKGLSRQHSRQALQTLTTTSVESRDSHCSGCTAGLRFTCRSTPTPEIQ